MIDHPSRPATRDAHAGVNRGRAALIVILAFAGAMPARAQEPGAGPRWTAGASFQEGLLVAKGGNDQLHAGSGFDLSLAADLLPGDLVRLRTDIGYVSLFEERPGASISTDNALLLWLAGLELGEAAGSVNPYVLVSAGAVANRVSAGALGDETAWSFAWGFGAGLRIRIVGRERPVGLDLGGRFVDPGALRVARTIESAPDVAPEDFGLLAIWAGVHVGLP